MYKTHGMWEHKIMSTEHTNITNQPYEPAYA